jgi:sarcosine oxidase subunit delta
MRPPPPPWRIEERSMLLIHCPYCNETLPEAEFTYAGEAHVVRPADPSSQTDDQWEGFLFIRANVRRVPHFERWRHLHGCGRFFNAARDSVSDKFPDHLQGGREKAGACHPDGEQK